MDAGGFTSETDLLVIGGGPGGYAAAFRAARLGVETTIVEATDDLGGVCLHAGCIPSKTLLHVVGIMDQADAAEQFGVSFGKPWIDLGKLREWKRGVIARLAGGLDTQCQRLGINRIKGRARFESSRQVAVAGERDGTVSFRRAIIATGSASIRLRGIEVDSPRVMHSGGALELADVPTNLLVIGGGYIGLELGSVYATLGSEVTVVEMLDSLLPGADADLVRPLARRLKGLLAEAAVKTRVTAMKEVAGGIEVAFEGDNVPKRKTYEKVLVAVGRAPNTAELGLENTAVELDERRFIRVDEQLRTADPHIHAVGDVVPGPMLAHKAAYEGKVAADVIAGHDVVANARAIPAVVFTDPEVAWCGLTETEAKDRGVKVVVKKLPWGASGRATAMGRTDGLTKIVFEPGTARVLGVAMCGPHAGEMIAEGVLAMQMGAAAKDIAGAVHPHPTLGEMMGEAAEMMEMAGRGAK